MHGQPSLNSEQKPTTKNFAGFHSHPPLLFMLKLSLRHFKIFQQAFKIYFDLPWLSAWLILNIEVLIDLLIYWLFGLLINRLIDWLIDWLINWLIDYDGCFVSSDPWNLLDSISILIFVIILTLRVITLLTSGTEMNNRALAVSGYLYSFNTLCLTLRIFGHVAEQSRNLGVIQIALFNILREITTILLQFIAGVMAFSIAITKVYMAQKSFVENGNIRNDM